MSSVLQALKRSEQQHNLTMHNPQASTVETPVNQAQYKHAKWLLVCLLVPTALWWGVHKAQEYRLLSTVSDLDMAELIAVEPPSRNALPKIEQAKVSRLDDISFVELPFPVFNELKSTRRNSQADELKSQVLSSHSLNASQKPVKVLTTTAISPQNKSVEKAITDNLDFGELSPELAQRFKAALQASELDDHQVRVQKESSKPKVSSNVTSSTAIALNTHQAQFHGRLPKLDLQGHMYSSNVRFSSVKVNQKEFFEGDWITPEVKLLSITPRTIEVQFDQQHISIPALFEWRG